MWKSSIAAGLTAVTIASASFAFAQQTPPPDATRAAPPAATQDRARTSADDSSAMTDARIAGFKAGLRLNAEQEKNWPAVEAAMREMDKQRMERMAERRAARVSAREARASAKDENKGRGRVDAMERLRSQADTMSSRATGLKRFADAAEPLYKSLDNGQKRRFAVLLRQGMRANAPEGGPGFRGRGR